MAKSRVTVTPQQFNLVQFDARRIRAAAEQAAALVGFDEDFRVEVDETTPLGRSRVAAEDPVVLRFESGALEDARHPRTLSELAVVEGVGRHLLKLMDRRDPAFAAPDEDEELELAHKVAWEIYSAARLARVGIRDQRQRWLYHFRNRCGFTDASDAAFEVLWTSETLSWPEMVGLVDGALAQRDPAPA
jgi:hypothetical protein